MQRLLARAATALVFTAAVATAPRPAQAQGGGKLDDPTIVWIFETANTFDIETGGQGARKGTTKEIRDYGAQLVRDHTAVRKQGRELAAKLKVTPTPAKGLALVDGLARDHAAAMKRLRTEKGKAFDRAFLENEVAYHKAVIDAVSGTLLPAIQNAELKDLVTKVAPAFQAHMAAAQNLLDKMK